jgi:protein-S-isoprenylcysteine O-methyltransferase Ste14
MPYLISQNNPELINERLKPGKGMKAWDRIYYILSTPLYFGAIILGSMDTGRLKLSPKLSFSIYIIAILVYILGQFIFMWARKTNNYFSSVVRIQKERGHKLCDSGPYKYVRHPGYLGGLLWNIATPLILGSTWALIPTAAAILLMIIYYIKAYSSKV